jgi:hypothetical protein
MSGANADLSAEKRKQWQRMIVVAASRDRKPGLRKSTFRHEYGFFSLLLT